MFIYLFPDLQYTDGSVSYVCQTCPAAGPLLLLASVGPEESILHEES
jgi:hypothetical protein